MDRHHALWRGGRSACVPWFSNSPRRGSLHTIVSRPYLLYAIVYGIMQAMKRLRRFRDCRLCRKRKLINNPGDTCQSCRERWLKLLQSAGSAVSAAVGKGFLSPASDHACVDCGRPAKEYDHRDYLKPLKVEPVCRTCNKKRGYAINTFEDLP